MTQSLPVNLSFTMGRRTIGIGYRHFHTLHPRFYIASGLPDALLELLRKTKIKALQEIENTTLDRVAPCPPPRISNKAGKVAENK